MFCDCCSGEFCPKALRLDEPVPMPEELLPPPPLLPNIPEEPIDEPPPDIPMPIPPLDIPPPELPNCAQTEPALTVMPNKISQERFNARHMGISL